MSGPRTCSAAVTVTLLTFTGQPAAVLAQGTPDVDPDAPRLTIERLYSLPNLTGTSPKAPAWSPDSRHIAFLWNDEGRNFHDVWILEARAPDPEPERITSMPRRGGPTIDPPDPYAEALAREALERDRGVDAFTWHPDDGTILFGFRGDLWTVEPGAAPTRLTGTRAFESLPSYSPAGDLIAFVRDGDLWLLPVGTAGDEAVRLTDVARPDVRVTGYRWSPDGSRIVFMERDLTEVAVRGVPDYLAEETRLNEIRRAYPGEEDGSQRLGIVRADVSGGEDDPPTGRPAPDVHWIELGGSPDEGPAPDMILGYEWSPDGTRLAVDTSDLIAKDRRIFIVDVGAGAPTARLLVREQDPENETFYFWRLEWSVGSDLLYFISDRDEDYHVWAVSPGKAGPSTAGRPAEAPELTQLTSGPWAVASMTPVEGGLIVVGNRGRGEERHIFRVSDDGGDPERLSQRPGTHSPSVSPDGRYAAVSFSSDETPPDLLITSLGPDRSERQVTWSPLPDFHDYRWAVPQYVTFPSHVDGTTLHGRLTLPPDFDPDRTYPAILGSVYTETVRNQWGGRTAHPTWGLDQYLAQEGYILLNVDMRGSWGRGREHRRGIRLDYGGMDIEDLESGVRYLETLGYVDMDRVGIWGSSYGGLMTAMSLFRKPGLYAAGIAGAPATSVWHALTGQMAVMLAPEDSPEEYLDSSPFMHAHGLEDPLMIVHGMRDPVVLFKDTITLVQRLIMLGKDVDLVTLPSSGHGWDNEGLAQTRFAFNKMVDFFNRHLDGGGG
jgi:dipeptidyl-peptidase-4